MIPSGSADSSPARPASFSDHWSGTTRSIADNDLPSRRWWCFKRLIHDREALNASAASAVRFPDSHAAITRYGCSNLRTVQIPRPGLTPSA